ncbi:NitT/TauT family transport system substrate-binding protein [Pedococcus cremeus]|uniref:Thiamine pyrimidine synthase n=1 Tax=Pedococcus cremeus TaxID=587636 RepID=A0A1H9WEL8_9MICO|nr:ABC transporter substrate-binding protein [Pedococcus cremeus]SES32137.1 NitT/TauT family transport system substrate-binding protein [Pedococcus cremeus]
MNNQPLSRRGFLGRSGLVVGTIAGSALLASCNAAAKQANEGKSAGSGSRNVSLQLGWLISEGQLGEAVALAKGYYADNGIKLSIQPGGPSIDGVSLVAGGRSQLGEVSSSPSLMLARSQGVPVKTFAVGVQEHPYAYVSLPNKPVHEPKDLIGKKVGTQATGQILLSALLAKNNIDPGDVEVVVIGADVTPLTTGQVDVWTGWLSNVTAMRPLKDKYVSMRLWDAGIHLYGYPYYTTDSVMSEQRDLVEKWVSATAKGWSFARENLQEAAEMVVKLQPTLKAEDIAAQGEVLLKYAYNDATKTDGWGTMNRDVWQSQLDTWTELKQFKGTPPKLEDFVTFDVLDATKEARKA